jgi:hypothetical protein
MKSIPAKILIIALLFSSCYNVQKGQHIPRREFVHRIFSKTHEWYDCPTKNK